MEARVDVYDNKPIRYVCGLAFICVPLLSTDILRLEFGLLQIPIFVALLFLLSLVFLLEVSVGHIKIEPGFQKYQIWFIALTLALLIIQLANSTRTPDPSMAYSLNTKLFISLLTFILIAFIFSNSPRMISFALNTTIVSSSIFLSIYIYRYLFVFHSSYLSVEWTSAMRAGRNSMGLYLAVVAPIALWKYLFKKPFSFWLLPACIHTFAAFYTMSRGSWVAIFVGFLLTLILIFIKSTEEINIKGIIERVALILLAVFLLSIPANFSPIGVEAGLRIESLRTMEDIEGTSFESRGNLLSESIDQFLSSPLIGIGTSNFYLRTKWVTHNDYAEILCEQGIVGFSIFIMITIVLIMNFLRLSTGRWEEIALGGAVCSVLIYFFFINAYTSILVFSAFSLFLCLKEPPQEPAQYTIDDSIRI